MNLHQAQNHDEKVRIAKAASQLVNPGESVVINCGSTAFLLGREMCGKPVQIITNYLPLANYLIDQEHDSVIIMGGQYNKSQSITLSPQEVKTVSMLATGCLPAEGLNRGWPVQDRYANRHGGTKNAQRRRETGRAGR